MVEVVVIRQIRSGDEIFNIGDKVKIHMTDEFVQENSRRKRHYIGTIVDILQNHFWMNYCGKPSYLTRDIPEEKRPYNECGIFRVNDVESIERIELKGRK